METHSKNMNRLKHEKEPYEPIETSIRTFKLYRKTNKHKLPKKKQKLNKFY